MPPPQAAAMPPPWPPHRTAADQSAGARPPGQRFSQATPRYSGPIGDHSHKGRPLAGDPSNEDDDDKLEKKELSVHEFVTADQIERDLASFHIVEFGPSAGWEAAIHFPVRTTLHPRISY